MTTPKKNRSSLHEGPLADLFRNTETPAAAEAAVLNNTKPVPPVPADPRMPAQVHIGSDMDAILGLPDVEPTTIVHEPSVVETTRASADAWDESHNTRSLSGGPVIRVVGVGGAGTNAITRMVEAGVTGVEFMVINTDAQALKDSPADRVIHIGRESTRGLGAGADPAVGRAAAMESYDEIRDALKGSDMVFIAAGAGGGTGTGAAPVVARAARELGALTVAIVTKPFMFEGRRRSVSANAGIAELAEQVDTVIVVPNNRLLSVLERGTSMVDAFKVADDVLRQGVQGISELVTVPGLINLDFADVCTVMRDRGAALLGIGHGTGESRAVQAAERAVASPLLETSVDGAKAILLSICGGNDLSLYEITQAAETISAAAHPDANIIFGAMVDPNLGDEMWVTVVATGFDNQPFYGEQEADTGRGRRVQVPDAEPRVRRAAPARSERKYVTSQGPSRRQEAGGWSVPEFTHDV